MVVFSPGEGSDTHRAIDSPWGVTAIGDPERPGRWRPSAARVVGSLQGPPGGRVEVTIASSSRAGYLDQRRDTRPPGSVTILGLVVRACGSMVFNLHLPPGVRVVTCTFASRPPSGSLTQAPMASPLEVTASWGWGKGPGFDSRVDFHRPFGGRLATPIWDSSL